jgi:hypothetical protein
MDEDFKIAIEVRIKELPNKMIRMVTPPTVERDWVREEYNNFDQQCVGLSQKTIFSYTEVLQTKEVLSDIKRLSFDDQDLTDEGRTELLEKICEHLAPTWGDSAFKFAIKYFWRHAEKYSDQLLQDIQVANKTLTDLLAELKKEPQQ